MVRSSCYHLHPHPLKEWAKEYDPIHPPYQVTPQGCNTQRIAQLLALSRVGPLTISFPSLNSGSPATCAPRNSQQAAQGKSLGANLTRMSITCYGAPLTDPDKSGAHYTLTPPPPPQTQSPSFFTGPDDNPLEASNRKPFLCQNTLLSPKCVSRHDCWAATAFLQWRKIGQP